MTTEHSAACYDCTYQSPWTTSRADADDARLEHKDNSPAHKITVISRAK